MNIVLLADSFPPFTSGVTTHTVELARWLLKKGHQVLILTPRPKNQPTLPVDLKEAKIVYLHSIPGPYPNLRLCLPNFYRVFKEIKNFDAEIIDSQAPSFLAISGLLSAKILSIPFISTFHTLFISKEYIKMIFKLNTGTVEKIVHWYLRWIYNSSARVFVCTPSIALLLSDQGIKKDIIELIPILFDFDKATLLDQTAKVRLIKKYNLKAKIAIYVGRISYEKNLDYLLEVWKEVVNRYPTSSLLIIGNGKYENHIKRRIKKLGLQDNVCMAGFIEHERLLKSGLFSIADAFISTSTSETFGLTALEAMAHEVPPVLIHSQGLCEFIDGDGFVCERSDKTAFVSVILQLFRTPYVRETVGKRARKFAAEFGGEIGVDRILNHYSEAIRTYQ